MLSLIYIFLTLNLYAWNAYSQGAPGQNVQITCPISFTDSFCVTCDDDAEYCEACASNYYPHDVTGECIRARSGNESPNNMVNNVKAYEDYSTEFDFMDYKVTQVLDPYCVLNGSIANDLSQYGSCARCTAYPNQYLTTVSLPGVTTSENPRYVGDDDMTCHSDCNYAAYGLYKDTQGQVSACKTCNGNCIKCTTGTNCNECIYSKQRIQSPASINNFLQASSGGSLTCSAAKTASTKTLVYYVSPADATTKRCGGGCSNSDNGSGILWDDLNWVFKDIITESSSYTAVDVKIYLLKNGTNLVHYLLDKDTENFYNYNYQSGTSGYLPRPFERTTASVYIGPIYCSDRPSQTGCLAAGEKPTIKWKSSMAHLFVTGNFLIENVIIDGADMTPSNTLNTYNCATTRKKCCTYNSGPKTTTQTNSPSSCTISNSDYSDWNVNATSYYSTFKAEKKYGIFVFEYIRDDPNAVIPTLTIKNCEINNFFYSKYHTSFIQMSNLAGNLVIEGTTFSRFFFPHGLISNTHIALDRNLYGFSSFNGEICRDLQHPTATECHSISITDSIFQEYNPSKTKNLKTNDVHTIEGAVLAVHNLDGPITIQGCTFDDMLAFNRYSTLTNSQYDCIDYVPNSWGANAPMGETSHDIIPVSKYKIFFDKHFRKYAENQNTNTSITAVLHIRNVTKGLVIHDNTFNKIYTVVGGAIYIEGFNNTFGAPIIVTQNQFTNNFAQLMGSNLFIYKFSYNIPRLNCSGIYVDTNTFTDNYGCYNTIGNVILACEANDYNDYSATAEEFASYYTSYSITSNHIFEEDTYSYRNFTRYLKSISEDKAHNYEYTHPIDSSITFNPAQATFSNNVFQRNFMKLSNGLYIQGVMNLLVKGNTFQENSIPTSKSYDNTEFDDNAFTLTSLSEPTMSSDIYMLESVPLIIRQSNYIQITDNIFDGNTQGFLGGDYYLAQAITLHQIIGQDSVLLKGNTFQNHQGFSGTIVDSDAGYHDFASSPLISFNFWEMESVYLKGLDEDSDGTSDYNDPNTFTVEDCIFQDNKFDFYALSDTKGYYYKTMDQTIYPGHQYPFSHLLKYFSVEEVIGGTGSEVTSFSSPVSYSSGPVMTSLYVSINSATVSNNEFKNGYCGFSSFWFNRFEINTANFYGNVIPEGTGNKNGIICVAKENIYNKFNNGSTISLNDMTFDSDTATLLYIASVNSKDPSSSESYTINVNSLTITSVKSGEYAPIHANSATSVYIDTVTASSFKGLYGLLYLDSTSSFNVNNIDVQDSTGGYTGLIYATSTSTTVISGMTATNNNFVDNDDDNDANYDDGFKWKLQAVNNDISTVLALIKQSKGTLTISDSTFEDNTNIKLIFAVMGGKLNLENVNARNLVIRDSLIFAIASSTITITNSNIYSNTGGDNCLAGVAVADSSKVTATSTNIYSNTVPYSGFSMSQMSTITFISSNISYLTSTNGGPSVLDAALGKVVITGSYFGYNNAVDGEAAIKVTLGYLTVTSSTFEYNFAWATTHNIYLVKLLDTATITSSVFKARAPVDDEVDGAYPDADFIVIYDSSVTISDTSFTDAFYGTVYGDFKSNTLTLTNIESSNNYCESGCISITGSLIITDSTFYNNTNTIFAETKNMLIQDTTFTNDKTQSVSVTCTSTDGASIVVDGVTFNGNPDVGLWDFDTVEDTGNDISGLYLISCSGVEVKDSTFKNLRLLTLNGAGLEMATEDSSNTIYKAEISNCYFYNNIAYQGGAIRIANEGTGMSQINMTNVTVDNCKAIKEGGGLYYDNFETSLKTGYTTSDGVDYLNLNESVLFSNCQADSAGGAIYYTQLRPISSVALSSGDLFSNNEASYGPNWASYPVKMIVVEITETTVESRRLKSKKVLEDGSQQSRMLSTTTFTWEEADLPDFVSGQQLDPSVKIGLIDIDDQLVKNWDGATLEMTFKDSTNLKASQSTSFTSSNGYFDLDPFELSFVPGNSTDIDITSSISQTSSDIISSTLSFSLSITPFFRYCQQGERLTDADECANCPVGKSLFEINSKDQCTDCPENMECYGGPKIGPVANYWRNTKWNDYAVPCVNDEACLGHTVLESEIDNYSCKDNYNTTFCVTGWCNSKYTGNLCSTCTAGNAKSSDIYCVACSSNPMYYVLAVFLIIAAICFIVFTVRNALKIKDFTKGGAKPKTSILIKIFLNYVQLVSIVATFDFEWPSEVTSLFSVQSKVSSSSSTVFSVDCFIPSSDSIKPFFSKLLFISASPLFLIGISYLVWWIIFLVKNIRDKKKLKSNLITTCVVLLFMLHTTLVQTSITGFRCKNLGDETGDKTAYYLAQDLDVECWGSTHLFWVLVVALPAFIIWGLGIPLFAFNLLRVNKTDLDLSEFKSKFGFLYDGYKKDKYYWEFVILYRKILMIFISVFMVTYGTSIQALSVLGVSFLSFILQIRGKPFQEDDLNSMEKKGLISATITIYCGIYYITKELPTAVNLLLIVVIFVVNVLFFASWLICILKEYKKVILKKFLKKNKVALAIGISGARANNETTPLTNLPLADEIVQGERPEDLGIQSFNSNSNAEQAMLVDDTRKNRDMSFSPIARNKIVPM